MAAPIQSPAKWEVRSVLRFLNAKSERTGRRRVSGLHCDWRWNMGFHHTPESKQAGKISTTMMRGQKKSWRGSKGWRQTSMTWGYSSWFQDLINVSDLHTKRSPTQSDIYQMLYWYNWFSWWWARGCSQQVQNWNKYIDKNCASSWSFTKKDNNILSRKEKRKPIFRYLSVLKSMVCIKWMYNREDLQFRTSVWPGSNLGRRPATLPTIFVVLPSSDKFYNNDFNR